METQVPAERAERGSSRRGSDSSSRTPEASVMVGGADASTGGVSAALTAGMERREGALRRKRAVGVGAAAAHPWSRQRVRRPPTLGWAENVRAAQEHLASCRQVRSCGILRCAPDSIRTLRSQRASRNAACHSARRALSSRETPSSSVRKHSTSEPQPLAAASARMLACSCSVVASCASSSSKLDCADALALISSSSCAVG